MIRVFGLLLLSASLTACSVYKSAMRKDFESASEGRVKPASVDGCEILPTGTAWLQREFPAVGTELLVSDNDLEVWKLTQEDGHVLIRSFRPVERGTESCRTTFADESDWGAHESAFLESL